MVERLEKFTPPGFEDVLRTDREAFEAIVASVGHYYRVLAQPSAKPRRRAFHFGPRDFAPNVLVVHVAPFLLMY